MRCDVSWDKQFWRVCPNLVLKDLDAQSLLGVFKKNTPPNLGLLIFSFSSYLGMCSQIDKSKLIHVTLLFLLQFFFHPFKLCPDIKKIVETFMKPVQITFFAGNFLVKKKSPCPHSMSILMTSEPK